VTVQPGKRLVVLGAGATAGSEFGIPSVVRPPLNRDFFTQLQRITGKHQPLLRAVVKDVIDLFGSNFQLTLEDYFTQLEFLSTTATGLQGSAKDKQLHADLTSKRDRLMEALSAVLEMSTNRAIYGTRARGCTHHRRIARSLEARDTVISFNYDCVMDNALRWECAGRWAPRWGYGFPPKSKIDGLGYWEPKAGAPAASSAETVYLLKLHGSLHWQLPASEGGVIKLKQRLHSQRGIPRFSIVPPEWNKTMRDQQVFELLWQHAYRSIQRAEHIAIVGFSFTPTDLHAESLFRLALRKSKLRSLVIANPSGEDRERIRSVFAGVLARRGCIVRQYASFEELTADWPACFSD
jgi:hypothetical protein